MFDVQQFLFSIKLAAIAASGGLKPVISPRYPICSLLQHSTFRIPNSEFYSLSSAFCLLCYLSSDLCSPSSVFCSLASGSCGKTI